MNDSEDRFKATTPGKRFMKLAGMSASLVKNYANHKVTNLFSDEARKKLSEEQFYAEAGQQIAQTLGEMKGAVMKVGQIASQIKDLFPKELAEALESLQKESPPMPYGMIRRQLIKALGEDPESLFGSFEQKPFAAASIGQVHRATAKDGRELVVKIQYPGVKESCESDLKQLKRALKFAGLFKVSSEAIDTVFSDIRNTLYEELDYVHEADNVAFFYAHYKDHPKIETPEVVRELSTDTVLTLTYVPGDSIKEVSLETYSQETINQLGELIFETIYKQIYEVKKVHSDPHPGNFAFRPDGTFIIYDFGAVKTVPPYILDVYRALLKDVFAGKYDKVDQYMRDLHVRTPNSKPIPSSYYKEWVDIIIPAFNSSEPYDFGQSDIHLQTAKKIRQDALKYLGYFQPSPDTLQVDRVISGHYWTMVSLGVQAAFAPMIQQIIFPETGL